MGNCSRCKKGDLLTKEIDYMNEYNNSVVRIQSSYRGFRYRKYYYFVNKKTTKVLKNTRFSLETNFLNPLSEEVQKSPKRNRKYSNNTYQTKKSVLGRMFTGDYDENNNRTGLGILKWPDGTCYTGYHKDNFMNGFGIKDHVNGDIYKGEWKADKANGKGVYIDNENAKFEGYWIDDVQEGFGFEIWPRGNFFTGEYVKGLKNGIGILVFEENVYYEGEFKNNEINGIGTFHFKDNKQYQGEWKNNKMHGLGMYYWPDGKVYEGSFADDKREGFGICYTEKKVYLGNWKDSKLEGPGILLEKGQLRKYIFKNSEKNTVLKNNYFLPYENLAKYILERHFKSSLHN